MHTIHILSYFSLKKLLLCNTKLTDEGMLFLAGLIHLEVLDLDRTLVTNDGANVIAGNLLKALLSICKLLHPSFFAIKNKFAT